MNARERIRAAIEHRPTDRIPVDMGAVNCTGINVNAYVRLKNYLHLCEDRFPKMHDQAQQLALPDREVLDRLGVDAEQVDFCEDWTPTVLKSGNTVLAPQSYRPRMNADGSQDWLLDGGKIFAHMTEEAQYFDLRFHPLEEVASIGDLRKITFGSGDKVWAEFVAARIAAAREKTDRAIVFTFGGNILEGGTSDFGFAHFMELLLTEPKLVHCWARKKADAYLKTLEILLPKIADTVDVIAFGDDLGTQTSTLVSEKTYREMIHPYHREIYQFTKAKCPKIGRFLHSCGAIVSLIPYIIEEGIQILNPVQISAAGMDAQMLKRRFGKELVFWGGGADMQHTVLQGTIEKIRDEVRRLCETFYSDGTGFVFNQVHNILGNVPPDKVMAIYDTVAEINGEITKNAPI